MKIAVRDCAGDRVPGLTPTIHLDRVDTLDGPVDEAAIVEASTNGKGFTELAQHYQYNLSTKLSAFADGSPLTAGTYRVTVDDPSFAEPVVIGIRLR